MALVPTMGNLHSGHLSLLDRAAQVADHTITSIFVNPTQFGPGEDFASYPRTLQADLEKLQRRGCDAVFAPESSELYPYGVEQFTKVDVPTVGEGLCDAHRPGHFSGVASVVCRLLNAVAPGHAVFGQKDYQQLQTIRRMVAELLLPVRIHAAEIVREASGLAMSSRNGYLSETQKQQASVIFSTLKALTQEPVPTAARWQQLRRSGLAQLSAAGLEPEYLELRDAQTLALPDHSRHRQTIVLIAAKLGSTRLIDNRFVPC